MGRKTVTGVNTVWYERRTIGVFKQDENTAVVLLHVAVGLYYTLYNSKGLMSIG